MGIECVGCWGPLFFNKTRNVGAVGARVGPWAGFSLGAMMINSWGLEGILNKVG